MRLRLRLGPNAFGNALGSSITDSMQADAREKYLAEDQMRAGREDAEADTWRWNRDQAAAAPQISSAQGRAFAAGAGPLTESAAQAWAALNDDAIGPAANGRPMPASKEQLARSAALRQRVGQFASDYWNGSGSFSPAASDNQTPISALKDTARVGWNLLMDVGAMAEGSPMGQFGRASHRLMGLDIPSASDMRVPYDTPSFGLTLEVLAPFIPARKLLGGPRTLGGAAFVDGKFVHDLKPLTNLELYGTAVSRTPDEATQILLRVGHDADDLAKYRFVKLSDSDYAVRSRDLGFDFDATYGSVRSGAPSVSFKNNIASTMADGTERIPVYVHKSVFDSDEAIVQILSHEMSEIGALRYVAAKPISVREYQQLVKQNGPNNLHFDAVQEGDWWLQRFRDMRPGKN